MAAIDSRLVAKWNANDDFTQTVFDNTVFDITRLAIQAVGVLVNGNIIKAVCDGEPSNQ